MRTMYGLARISLAVACAGSCAPLAYATPYAHYDADDEFVFGVLHVPDLDQRRGTACASSLPNNGASYCAPTSLSNWLAYAAARGFETMWTDIRDWGPGDPASYPIATDYIEDVGTSASTDPDVGGGTSPAGTISAAQTWFGNDFDIVHNSASTGDLDLISIAQAGFAGGLGILGYARYDVSISPGGGGCDPDQNQTWSLQGLSDGIGHVVSLSRYEVDADRYFLAFRDPDDSNLDLCSQDDFESRVVEMDYWEFENGGTTACTLRFTPARPNPQTVDLVNFITMIVPDWSLVDLDDPDDGDWFQWGAPSGSGVQLGGPSLVAPPTSGSPVSFDIAPNRSWVMVVEREGSNDVLRGYTPFGANPSWKPFTLDGSVNRDRAVAIDPRTIVVEDGLGLRILELADSELRHTTTLAQPATGTIIAANKVGVERSPLPTGAPVFGTLSDLGVPGERVWRTYTDQGGTWQQDGFFLLLDLQNPVGVIFDPLGDYILIADQRSSGLVVNRYRPSAGSFPIDQALALFGQQATRFKPEDDGEVLVGFLSGEIREYEQRDLDGDGLRELTPVARPRYADLLFANDFAVTTTARAWRDGEHASLFRVFNDLGPTGLGVGIPDCDADLNLDGVLNHADVKLFIGSFLRGEALADFDGNGALDRDDIIGFVRAFVGKCA